MTLINVARRLTESVTVKRLTSHSSSGDAIRGTTLVLPARIERAVLDVAEANGRAVGRASRVITVAPILLGDLLFFPEDSTADVNAGRLVEAVTSHRALDGTITHYTTTV